MAPALLPFPQRIWDILGCAICSGKIGEVTPPGTMENWGGNLSPGIPEIGKTSKAIRSNLGPQHQVSLLPGFEHPEQPQVLWKQPGKVQVGYWENFSTERLGRH